MGCVHDRNIIKHCGTTGVDPENLERGAQPTNEIAPQWERRWREAQTGGLGVLPQEILKNQVLNMRFFWHLRAIKRWSAKSAPVHDRNIIKQCGTLLYDLATWAKP